MIKKETLKDTIIENVLTLNNSVEIISVTQNKYHSKILTLRCKSCGNTWNISYRSFKSRPLCPKCNPPKRNDVNKGVRYTTDTWVEKVKTIHPELLYDRVEYKNSLTKVEIGCKEHGYYYDLPKRIIQSDYVCPKCKIKQNFKLGWEEFKKKAQIVHSNKYTYPDQDFYGIKHKIRIICTEHGEFIQNACNHLNGSGCPECANMHRGVEARIPFQEFVDRARAVHGDIYTYHEDKYTCFSVNTTISCPIHGDFQQTPGSHVNGARCPMCLGHYGFGEKGTKHFIERAKSINGDKYDYSKTVYHGRHEKLIITCHALDEFGEEHGDFKQTAGHHLRGVGCPKCSHQYMDDELFKKRSAKIHQNKYDYSLVTYTKNNVKVPIICPEHGKFLQTPNCHMLGQGCPLCKTSHLERTIDAALKQLNRLYTYQYHNKAVFGQQSLDFYLGAIKLGIECQGEQHYIANFFKSKGMDYAEEHLKYIQELDEKKRVICKEQGIELVYFQEKKFNQFVPVGQKVFNDVKDLVRYIESKFV